MGTKRLEFAKYAAKTVGEVLLDHFYTGSRQVELKADHSLVTEADRKADLLLQELIRGSFPSDGILSEESSTVFPDNEHVWIIDPLDGTVNFSLGLHYWGVSVAHLQEGYPENVALYFPVINELFLASAGKGAEFNGKTLHIANPLVQSPHSVFVHCSRMHKQYQVSLPYKQRSIGSAAYSLCLVTKGTAILAFESIPKIWDIAGSWLIVEEAGGFIQTLDGQHPFPAQPGIDYVDLPFTVLSASSEKVIKMAREKIVKR